MKIKRLGLVVVSCILAFNLVGCCITHEWKEATCTEPKICTKCNKTDGNALGHEWKEATCTEPKTCTRCGKTEGAALGHSLDEFTIISEATHTENGIKEATCSRCGVSIQESVEKLGYTESEIKGYSLALNMIDSLKQMALYPDSFDVKGIHYIEDKGICAVYFSMLGGDEEEHDNYFHTKGDVITNLGSVNVYEQSGRNGEGITELNWKDAIEFDETEYYMYEEIPMGTYMGDGIWGY